MENTSQAPAPGSDEAGLLARWQCLGVVGSGLIAAAIAALTALALPPAEDVAGTTPPAPASMQRPAP
jgi:hypothetical protein